MQSFYIVRRGQIFSEAIIMNAFARLRKLIDLNEKAHNNQLMQIL